jgi:type V secretory pathway adhesin AidA
MAIKIGSEFLVNTYIDNSQSASSVASLTDGGFMIVWESENQDNQDEDDPYSGVYGQRYDANGNPLGSEFLINTFTLDEQYNPSVASLANILPFTPM